MPIDSYYEIGGAHIVCEDYALHGQFKEMEYVIVSDGCSTAEHTEIGSQMLCHVAKYYLSLFYSTGIFDECQLHTIAALLGNSILRKADELRKLYPITQKALEATLLIAVRIGLKTYAFGWGDGVFIEKYKNIDDGSENFRVVNFEYPSNAPYYLIYDRERYADAMTKKGIDEPKVIYNIYQSNMDPHWDIGRADFDQIYMYEYEDVSLNSGSRDYLQSITICSDGISSYKDDEKNLVDLLTIVPEFSTFKSVEGEFVKRRMQFLKRTCQQKEWTHYDDVSNGTIYANLEKFIF